MRDLHEVIIKFYPSADRTTIKNHHNKMKAVVIEENELLGFQVLSSAKPVTELINYYSNLPETRYVRPNQSIHISLP